MAKQNPDHPTETVPLGGQPSRAPVPPGQLSKKEAHEEGRKRLDAVLRAIDKAADDFQRVPGDELLDNALTALNFCRGHLTNAVGMLKE